MCGIVGLYIKNPELQSKLGSYLEPTDRMEETDIEALREAGADDGDILEVNQVCASFNYSTRVLNGLGIKLDQNISGYYSDEPTTGST